MLTFIKFGGSTITQKSKRETANLPIIRQLAAELHAARQANPGEAFLLGHGSGSFGHHYAAHYGVHQGIAPDGDWMGFALTACAARKLNHIVVDELLAAGVPALALQPSAALHSAGRALSEWHTGSIARTLEHSLVPVIHGDVAFDTQQGSAIMSTEDLFTYLATHSDLTPARVVLVGETAVYTADPFIDPSAQLISLINEENIGQVLNSAGGSRAVDVTGGMHSKIAQMWHLVEALPGLHIHLIGPQPALLRQVLTEGSADDSTLIRKG
jgi:isopentenyl phosphate kinase